MVAVNIVADKPAGCAPYQHIGGEVLLTEDASEAYPGGKCVDGELGQSRIVFIGEDGGGGPGQHAVGRRESGVDPGASLEEFALVLIDKRPFAPEDQLHALLNCQAIDDGLD